MFRMDDKIAVAVSGGKDSLVLLHILNKIEKNYPSAEIFAVTVDEGIKGYREEAIKFVEEYCKKLKIKSVVVSFKKLYSYTLEEIVNKIKSTSGELTPCSYCGVLRRKALNKTARELGATKLATAHNLDDETQTILLNIVHGDVLRSARVEPVTTPIHKKFIQRVKPLCEIPENEVALYAYLKNIRFQTIRCPYAQFALRTELREFINRLEAGHSGIKFTIFRSLEKLRPILKKATEAKLKECKICGEPTITEICESCRMIKKFEINFMST
jgi:uncharacterized protein (TIGR00269 family)